MAGTYSFDITLADDVSKVRQRIGDTDAAHVQVYDETIQAYLDQGMSVLDAARRLCLDLAGKWAQIGDIMIDGQRTMGSTISKHYIELAGILAAESADAPADTASTAYAGIMVGGLDDCRGPLDRC